MKKFIPVCITVFLLWGCSASSPSVTSAVSSDSTPVTGQKVLFQVVSVSDNPPMTYTWQCDSGALQPALGSDGTAIGFFEYWTAPDVPGPTTVSCTVTDDRDETETFVFNVDVRSRELSLLNEGDPALSMEKQRNTDIAGVWISTVAKEIRYITSAADQLSTWTGTFGTMHIGYDYNDLYTLWGAPALGNEISVENSNGTTTLTPSGFGSDNKINDLIIDVIDSALLLVAVEGTQPGTYWYSYSSETWGQEPMISEKTYAFFPGQHYTYAATSAGIYELGNIDENRQQVGPLYSGDTCAVLEVVGDDKTTMDVVENDTTETVWHVTKDGGGDWKVWKNGIELSMQPPEVACTLDVDLKGRIWCGKYCWDGSTWQTPPDPNNYLVGEAIKTTVASLEGRIYFLTESGALFRW